VALAAFFLIVLVAVQVSVAEPVTPGCAAGPITLGDTTYGTPCADVIVAPAGVETVRGGAGNDTIVPGPITAASPPCPSGCFLGVGSQTFEGGPGDDIVFGQRGNDTLRGGEGNDHLFGGIGDDLLRGGPGNDRLGGGFGADSIDGEGGDDYVHGDGTIDRIFDTGGGSDTLSYATGITPGFGDAVGAGFGDFPDEEEGRGVQLELEVTDPEPDVLNGDNGLASFGGGVDKVGGENFETVIGTPFSDFIAGTEEGQTVYGGGGADVILGDGDLNGGADGDYLDGTGSAAQRDPAKISVGFMTPGQGAYSQLYLTGSNGKDIVTATYSTGAVTFTLTAGTFDQSASAAAGCTIAPTPTQATCPLATPLDSILLAGMDGDDTIAASGFPSATTIVVLGGKGSDSLNGGDASEDVLVDGPGTGAGSDDVLSAFAGDDALLHNGGADQRFGGVGNDLFLSVSICDGDLIRGEADRDNASWARLKGEAAGANLGSGKAGEPGAGGAPVCGSGPLDSLQEVEDLEGSEAGDSFYGDAGPNQLLGHKGPDTYSAAAGGDTILANSGEPDPSIDCGADIDRALVDHPEYGDAVPVNCEAVVEADPNSFQILPDFPIPTPPPAPTPSPPAPAPPATRPPPRPPRDTKPPQTTITIRPRAVLTTHRARRRVLVRFAGSEPGSTFRCKLDGGPYRPCVSPRAYSLAIGNHTIRIRAIDAAGNADPTPALLRLKVRGR
jgi:Ca2+-binding RTX toxin-like protein